MVLAVAATAGRELLRRRVSLALVTLLPLAFFLARVDTPGQAVRFLALGVGWAIATLALFSHVNARHLDQRLAVVGASPVALFLGRQLTLVAAGLAVAGVYFGLVAATQDLARLWVIALLLVTTVLVAAPLGAVVSLLLPRELEGALALLTIMAVQMLADPAGTAARLLPLWSTRELGTYAIDPVPIGYLHRGLWHAAAVLGLCLLSAGLASVVRLRPRRVPEVVAGR